MRKILLICGSGAQNSANIALLELIANEFSDSFQFDMFDGLRDLPLFTVERLKTENHRNVEQMKEAIRNVDSVVISTPEYLHNMPAVLKNALEWMTESGELANKPVLPITFTPHEPRGQYAMRSLLQSLKASKAKVVAELALYQKQLRTGSGEFVLDEEHRFLLREALNLL